MTTRTQKLSFISCLLVTLPSLAWAQWQNVAPGIDYQDFTLPDPNNLFVTRMDRSNLDCIIDSCISQGAWQNGRQAVSGMAALYDDSINYWGQSWGSRSHVVAAINGDYFDYGTNLPAGGQISSAWYAKRFGDWGGYSGFAWQLDRDVFIGGCVRHIASKQKVAYPATGHDQNLNNINTARGANELILYTPQFGSNTGTAPTGVEVVVEMARPALIIPSPNYARGTVLEIRQNMAPAKIQFDQAVLSAEGSAATTLLSNVSVGSEIRISQEITHYDHDCSTPYPWDWTKTYASIGGHFHCVEDGVVPSEDWADNAGATARHPRTAVAFNENYVYFVVVDGRSAQSIGMTITELGNFCLNTLNADHATAQDGGGSSTLWVDGEVKNVPSDGAERLVANGLMMVRVDPEQYSTAFAATDPVWTTQTAWLRLGPGSNHAAVQAFAAGAAGTVVDHDLNGVYAKGTYWWKCEFGSAPGWVDEASLTGSFFGDADGDGDVDCDDYAVFADCMAGPDATPSPTPPTTTQDCLDTFDADVDLDVDLGDFAAFQESFTGPGGICTDILLTGFEGYANGTEVMFQHPLYSGSTSEHLATMPDVNEVTDEVAAFDGDKCFKLGWQFVDTTSERWLRATSYNAANVPNPTIELDKPIRVRLRLDSGSLLVTLGVRETGTTAPVGQDGGTTGTIEWVGASSAVGFAPQGKLLTADPGVWQTLVFDPGSDPILGFTGDGVLSSPTNRGTLEHLAFSSTGGVGPFTVYIDEVEQLCEPP